MQERSSDSELVRKIRGSRSQTAFAKDIGVSQPVVSEYENGTIKPSADVWLKIARLARDRYPLNVECWERAGLDVEERGALFEALRIENEPRSQDAQERLKMREAFRQAHVLPEDATGPLGDKPAGGEPESLKGPSKSVEQFWARNPAVKTDSATGAAIGPLEAEAKPAAPAKKAKRQRRKK